MEQVSAKQIPCEELPSLLQSAAAKEVAGFDSVECGNGGVISQTTQPAAAPKETEAVCSHLPAYNEPQDESKHSYSLSISLPTSPSGFHVLQAKQIGSPRTESTQLPPPAAVQLEQPKQGKFHSQPIPAVSIDGKVATMNGKVPDRRVSGGGESQQRDKRFDSFKTWSGRLERQLSNLRGKPQDLESGESSIIEAEDVPAVDRYFDALEGPELDTLRVSEVSVLPEDKKWPFLLRFPISSFGMCLGVSSQAILWKTLATSPSTSFLHVSITVNLVLWCVSLALMSTVAFVYLLKIIFYFEAVKREYYHPVRVNFFFAPWIACLFLVQGVPPTVAEKPHNALWYALMAPIFCLELKIYGQWMSGGQRRLSKVANPSNHLSIVGNFVGALVGASMGLKEGPIFFFAIGLAHYTVLFVTLYQRLPTNETLPKELHPVFFLFVAAPSVACMAWAAIKGDFDYGSRIAYFIALFLYVSLAVRINFFRGFRFSLAWWAYTFPMTGFSIATIKYSMEVTNALTQTLSVGFSVISTFTVSALFITTIIHAFVLHDLFPNDIPIAITQKRPKFSKFIAHLRSLSSDMEAAISKDSLEI
ncbi:S-type anion channel SLAH2-like isoform X1 [Canna indica]|uniref:S-type anion channel SLAH2-like isoform X1 n=1 Tax=Canna indica TaxID=4628 RepID=A0AAQ3KU39_9LILI|nr:S-type anion channel SLAH2-like isoform X1 [Canna indica]